MQPVSGPSGASFSYGSKAKAAAKATQSIPVSEVDRANLNLITMPPIFLARLKGKIEFIIREPATISDRALVQGQIKVGASAYCQG